MAGDFLDSNVLIYAFTADRRAARAQALLQRHCAISVQGLNEFANFARRKLGRTWTEIRTDLAAIRILCPTVIAIDAGMHETALRLSERHNFAFFDGLMVAAALRAGSDTLWSEDMHDGMIVDERLRIANPFRAAD